MKKRSGREGRLITDCETRYLDIGIEVIEREERERRKRERENGMGEVVEAKKEEIHLLLLSESGQVG